MPGATPLARPRAISREAFLERYPNNLVVGDRGIYFLAVGDSPSKTSIDFYEFGSGRRTTLAKVGKPWWSGIALSADQRWLLFAAIDRDGSDLMLVDRAP